MAICRDLLNPLAVHALTEAGVNLVLAPAMSETLVPFGGPVAQLVAANQALVVVANNPAQWPDPARPSTDRRPARALFGHPGFGQQARFVPGPDPGPGLARLHVHSGALGWLPAPMLAAATPGMGPVGRRLAHPTDAPGWVARLAERTGRGSLTGAQPAMITLQTAAVLVLLTDAPAGPRVLLTRRATDLADYPGKLVFPGGATDRGDRGPVATALREAREEIGLDPDSVQVIGLLPAQALTDSGFLVTPVLAWAVRPAFPAPANLAEVDAIFDVPLLDRAAAPPLEEGSYGRMTAAVLDLLEHMLTARPPHHGRPALGPGAPFVDVDVVDRVDEADPPRTGG